MNLTPAQIRAIAATAGFNNEGRADLDIAVAVAQAESGGRADVIGRLSAGSLDYGVWQINSVHRELLAKYQWSDPVQNAKMAWILFEAAGYEWTPWAAYNNGSYLKFMPPPTGTVISVAPGDTLSKLALVYLGDKAKWSVIWKDPHNATLVAVRGVPEKIRPGDKLFIPARP